MIKFTVKGLIALFVTSSTLFLTPMKSDAQVNMKILAEVADSCHKDVPSTKYYQQMRLESLCMTTSANSLQKTSKTT